MSSKQAPQTPELAPIRPTVEDAGKPGPAAWAGSPLAELLNHMAGQAPQKYSGRENARDRARNFHIWPTEPPETDYFQKTWAKLGTSTQLKQSEHQVPENAGPLNSSQLIHRALLLMQEQSADYLQHFLNYADTLAWLQQLNTAATAPSKTASPKPASPSTRAATRSATSKKPPRKT